MSSFMHPTTGGLRLRDDELSRRSYNHGLESVQSPPIDYFGGTFGNLPRLDPPSVYTNKDGTRVIFDIDPRSANRNSIIPTQVETQSPSTPANLLRDAISEIITGEILAAKGPPKSLNSALKSIMASIGNNDALLLLANVALGNYAQEQQLAHGGAAGGAVHGGATQGVDNTPASQSANSASSEVGLFDDYQEDEQQPAHTSGEGGLFDYSSENEQQPTQTTQNADNPPSPAQAASSQGFTPIDPAAITGGFTPRMTRSRTRHAATPIGPSGGRQPVTKKSQKSKPRTTGFNKNTGQGIYTDVCGVVTPAKGKLVPVRNKTGEKSRYGCPRCNGRFTRARTVKDHFIRCVRDYGNPKGVCWYDHPTLKGSKLWALDQMATVTDDENVEGDEYEHDDEQDDDADSEHGHDDDSGGQECGDQDYDNEEQYEQDGSIAQAAQSDNTPVEEYPVEEYAVEEYAVEDYQDGGSHVGEDQGPYTMYAGLTPYYTPNGQSPFRATNQGSPFSPNQASPFSPNQGSPFYAPNQGSETPGYGPNGYQTPDHSNVRGWSSTPQHQGGSYTPSFGLGYETPAQQSGYDSDENKDTDIIRRRETEGYGDETPTPYTDDDGDSIMS